PPPAATPTPVCQPDKKCEGQETWQNCPNDCPKPTAAIIGDIQFGKPKYNAGETVEAKLQVQNTGSVRILKPRAVVTATVTTLKDGFANSLLPRTPADQKTQTAAFDFTEPIPAGETKTLTTTVKTEKEKDTPLGKLPLAGQYDVKVTVEVDGVPIGDRTLKLTLD
ncbi:MAG: hypothetical protein HY558_03910, partial [Euryarchaeota archaeon]|nr:hypothetical protein [Euryarchaeota archaeon]